ncbi:MAG TPA: hypothetical protein VFB62_26705 [Polyangiaceae bacterium]|nr:hypothetical protein [Polyangiaceae bacterium]
MNLENGVLELTEAQLAAMLRIPVEELRARRQKEAELAKKKATADKADRAPRQQAAAFTVRDALQDLPSGTSAREHAEKVEQAEREAKIAATKEARANAVAVLTNLEEKHDRRMRAKEKIEVCDAVLKELSDKEPTAEERKAEARDTLKRELFSGE